MPIDGMPVQHPEALPRMRQLFKELNEWKEAILLLVTAVDIASDIAHTRSELVPYLALVVA